MDSFTENILSRARERQRLLKDYSNNGPVEREPSSQSPRKSIKSNSTQSNTRENIASSSTESPGKLMKTNTLNIQKDNLNMEIRVTSSEDVRVEVEIDEENKDDTEAPETSAFLRKDAKERLNRLGKLYSGGDDANLSSPIHRSEEKFLVDETEKSSSQTSPKKTAGKGLRGLADLAQEINHWEDDVKPKNKTEEQSTGKSRFNKGPAPRPPAAQQRLSRPSMIPGSPISERINRLKNVANNESAGKDKENVRENSRDARAKAIKWDQAVLDNLESQGFRKNPNDSKLEYDYKESNNDRQMRKEISSPIRKMVTKPAIADRAARFEAPINNRSVDPSALSISERKALFEKNRGDALLPKAPFGMSVPISSAVAEVKTVHKPLISKIIEEKSPRNSPKSYTAPQPPKTYESQQAYKTLESPKKIQSENEGKPSATQANGIANTVAALLEKRNTISQSQIQNDIKEERKKEMDLLLNRFKRKQTSREDVIEEQDESLEDENESYKEQEKSPTRHRRSSGKRPSVGDGTFADSDDVKRIKVSPSKPRKSTLSPKVAAALDVKPIKVSPNKPGRLYPNLSDIEATTENEDGAHSSSNNSSFESDSREEEDMNSMNTSFGREVMRVVSQNQTPMKRVIDDESTASDLSDVLDDMDDYLDEALAYNEQAKRTGPTPPKTTKTEDCTAQPSHSFNYKNYTPKKLPTHIVEGDEVLPLTHTVSFYRKQTTNTPSKSPAKQTVQRESVEEHNEKVSREEILEKIKSLQNEVNKQQMIISQTSQALNLCNNTLEFMGSTEQVEAEKVLLLATHRRQAMLNEIQRLKVEETLRPQNDHSENVPLEKGTLTISNIRLPLKKEYVRALAAAGGKGHHVSCLVKCGEEVTCTKLASTVASDMKNPNYELVIPGSVTLKNIYSDFAVTFEVYCLQAQEEVLPHEVKYHIKKSAKATPKKSKHADLLSRPVKESPAGPQAVRSPTFAMMGYVVFSIHQMNKKLWSLNNAPSMSPLEGNVEMKVTCELTTSIEHRGFLTMFEDISGFGAWHRRWCLLKGDSLSYWKYPDDEKKLPPIDTVDLKRCTTKDVGPVSRDICARLHTFLLETVRDAQPQDRNTLVVICKGDETIVRHLLSADTKEERIQWCTKFNSALKALKLWGTKLEK